LQEKGPLRKLLRALFAEDEKESLDAAAVVEELPGGPKPMIEVLSLAEILLPVTAICSDD
jgi:hypothetical protein